MYENDDLRKWGVTGVGGTAAAPVGTTPITILANSQFRPHLRIPSDPARSQLVTTTKMSEIGRLVAEIWHFEYWHNVDFEAFGQTQGVGDQGSV